MDKRKQDIAYLLSFCIEKYENEKGIKGVEVFETFARNVVLNYLSTTNNLLIFAI